MFNRFVLQGKQTTPAWRRLSHSGTGSRVLSVCAAGTGKENGQLTRFLVIQVRIDARMQTPHETRTRRRSRRCDSVARIRSRLLQCLAAAAFCAAAPAQDAFTSHLNPLSGEVNGLHLYSVYGFSGYFSSPRASYGSSLPIDLGADLGFGGGASIGWNYIRSRSGISLTYSPSYTGFRNNSNLNSWNHGLSLQVHHRRQPGTRWQTAFSIAASAANTTQFLFDTPAIARIAGAPATFDELAGGIVGGNFANDQIASLLTGASAATAPAELLLYGERVLHAGVQGSVSYAQSPRLSISASVSGSRFQSLPSDANGIQTVRLMSNSTSGRVGVGLSYSRSSRTQLGFDVSTTRVISRYEDVYSTAAVLSAGRLLSRRWFAQLRAGAATITPIRQAGNFYRGPQFVGGGGIGFKTLWHTIMLSYDVLRADPYGIGAESNHSATAAWVWHSRRTWSASLSGSYFRATGGYYALSNSWRTQAALSKALSRTTGVSLRVSALSNDSLYTIGNAANRPLVAAVLAVYWSPGGTKHRPTE
jgi:hypothetical protein